MTPRTEVRAAIVGCGLIGRKRAASLPPGSVAVCCDTQPDRAAQLAAATRGAAPSTDWLATVRRDDVDAVFIATTHDQLAPIAAQAAAAGKHVLIEKPGARRARENDAVAEAARRTGALVRVGFNHRLIQLQTTEQLSCGGQTHGGRPSVVRPPQATALQTNFEGAIEPRYPLLDRGKPE